ncbi:uncharacterized protein LOC135540360 isoform X4 [Oncorhynchus masou masou]|uniref:uncharacterized protein LOC135540360 isoform X4 n=1 Tax=Oncorhynchus masou masou TaxID=90313 RepID=UPI00318406FE
MVRPKRTCRVGVCRACGENISNRIYVHNLFSQFEGQCLKPFDYTTALEDLTGPISQDDALPQIICETCRKLLKRYYKSFCDVEKIGSIFRESAQKQRESHSLAWRTRDAQQGEISITPFPHERMTDACKVTPRDLTVTLVVVPKSEYTGEEATPHPNNDNIKPEPAEISVYLEEDMEQDPQSGDDAASSKLSQVSVPTKYILTGPMEKLVDNMLNGQFFSAAKAIMEIPDLAPLVTKEVLNQVVKECKELTSVPFNSILRQTSPSSLEAFRWDTVFTEWKTTAPTFLRFLESASTSTWVSALTKERTQRKNFAIGMAGATLLKVRCGRMSAPMYRNSLIMHQAQKKKCFNRFARLGVCVTKQSMLHLLRRVRASEGVTRTPSAGEDHNYDSVAPRRSTENTDRQQEDTEPTATEKQEDPEPTATEKQQEPRTSLGEEQLPDSGTTESTTVTCTPLFRSKNHGQGPSKCQAKPKPLPKPQPQPQHQAQPQPQHQAQPQPQHQAQPQPQHQAQPQPQHQAQPQPQHQAQPQPQHQAQPHPQHQAQPQPQAQPQGQPQPQAQHQAQPQAQHQAQPKPQPFPTTFLLAQPFQTAQNQTVVLSKQNAPLMIFTLPYVQSPAAQSEEVKGVESTTLHNYNVPCSCQVYDRSPALSL